MIGLLSVIEPTTVNEPLSDDGWMDTSYARRAQSVSKK